MSRWFARATDWTTAALGTPWAILLSIVAVVAWALSGPLFEFSDTWQLIINTSTTVVTFWMAFVILASQIRSDKAMHLKLDEIIRWMESREPEEAIGAEERTEEEIDRLRDRVRQSRETGC